MGQIVYYNMISGLVSWLASLWSTFSVRLPVQDTNLLKQKLGQSIRPG